MPLGVQLHRRGKHSLGRPWGPYLAHLLLGSTGEGLVLHREKPMVGRGQVGMGDCGRGCWRLEEGPCMGQWSPGQHGGSMRAAGRGSEHSQHTAALLPPHQVLAQVKAGRQGHPQEHCEARQPGPTNGDSCPGKEGGQVAQRHGQKLHGRRKVPGYHLPA